MPDMYDNYRMVEEVKERAVSRGSGSTEFESYDRVAKIEFNNEREKDLVDFRDYHANGK
jgi:hypothetical protein